MRGADLRQNDGRNFARLQKADGLTLAIVKTEIYYQFAMVLPHDNPIIAGTDGARHRHRFIATVDG